MSDTAETFDAVAFCCTTIAQAIRDDDPIAGTLASEGLLTNLALLPPELRQMLTDAMAVPAPPVSSSARPGSGT